MPCYALFYDVVENFIKRRSQYRQQHLRLVREAHADGSLILAGAFAEPADRALLVFRDASPAAAEQFALNDPYVIHGLVTRWEVRLWNVVVSNEPEPQAVPPNGKIA